MEPVTHTLAGAVLSRSGLNRLSAYTTAAMVIGAEFPDIDMVWNFVGPVEGFRHHRGFTHTFLGIPFEAALIVAGFWLFDRWRRRKPAAIAALAERNVPPSARHRMPAAPHWGWLYSLTLLALLSHIALDWTNNYGVRPLSPFYPGWHAGSLLFIFDPLVFLFLLSAVTLPTLFRLISNEIGAASQTFVPRRWAIGALLGIGVLLGVRAVEHSRAVDIALAEPADAAADPGAAPHLLTPRTVSVSPDPFSFFRWHGAADFGPFLQLEEIDSRRGLVNLGDERLDKPPVSPALQSAFGSPLGQLYLDWSPMPVVSVSEGSGDSPDADGSRGGAANTVVFLRDPRFMGAVPLMDRGGIPPLTGTVEVDSRNRVIEQSMDGRAERPHDRVPGAVRFAYGTTVEPRGLTYSSAPL